MKSIYYTLYTTIMLLLPSVVFGRSLKDAGGFLGSVGKRAGVANTDLPTAVGSAISIILALTGLIFMVLTVYAGVLWLTARGEEGQVTQAKKIITSATIGLFLTISAYAITIFVTGRLGS